MADQARELLRFFTPTLDKCGRFVELDDSGRALPTGCPPSLAPRQQLLTVARALHCFALGELLGVPGCHPIVERGLETLWEDHRDDEAGGYFSAVADSTVADSTKSAYGHAFVLLAASTAIAAGHSAARQLWQDALTVIDDHFWSDEEGGSREAFTRTWDELEQYRGANSNMHLCEAFLAAADVVEEPHLTGRAMRIAKLLIDGQARTNGWLLPEHYDTNWRPIYGYNTTRLDDPFRPAGVIVGHLLEWSRLLVSLALATTEDKVWLLDAAQRLFLHGAQVGWDQKHGGLAYTVDWDGVPLNTDHYWWPIAEGIGASAYLLRVTHDPVYDTWYRTFWHFAATHLIDHDRGGWYAQMNAANQRTVNPWYGKPDVYHAFQACILPILPLAPSLAGALR
ncbi:MAG: AGE family epimerase/isomerase [Candidatus Dormibacteria bacterium]